MRGGRPCNALLCSPAGPGGRATVGTNLHKQKPFQRETAQRSGAGDAGLSRLVETCQPLMAAWGSCAATHLFQSLDLEGQARVPIRGLPVFSRPRVAGRAWAEPRPALGEFRRFVAISACDDAAVLSGDRVPAISSCQEHLSRKGNWQCRPNKSHWPSHSAAGSLPVGRQPANRSYMVPAQGRSARSFWTATLSPARLSAPLQTSFTARKTQASADSTSAFLALTFRPSVAGSPTIQMPCPDVFRGRHLAFRPHETPGPTRAQGTANV